MSTRVRFIPSTGVRYSSLPFSTYWDVTTSAVRRVLDVDGPAGLGGSQTSLGLAEVTSTRQSKLVVQFQSSKGLTAQTITGFLKGQMQVMESDVAMDAALAVHVRVVDPVTNLDRGVLWAPDKTFIAISATPGTEAYEMSTTKTNRKAPQGWSGSGHSVGSLAVQNGDILVVELGYRHCNTASTSYTGTIYYAGDPASDLPQDETTTTTGTGWLEFSQTLAFEGTVLQEIIEVEVPLTLQIVGGIGGVGQMWPKGAGRQ